MDDFELELKKDFLTESTDLLENAEKAFLRLESERQNPALLNEIFRLAHNLKGTSRAVGFGQLSELTHTAENLILKLKEGELPVSDSVVTALLEFKDKIQEMIEGLKENIEAVFDIGALQRRIEQEISGGVVVAFTDALAEAASADEAAIGSGDAGPFDVPDASAFDVPDASVFEEEQVLKEGSALVAGVQEVTLPQASLPSPVKTLLTEVPGPSMTTVASEAKNSASANSDIEESVRVKLSRIDKLNNIMGELVILQTVISQRRFEFIHDDLSNKTIGIMSKLFKEAQEMAMSLRMLPIKTTFQKMTRIVRDTSKALEKDVDLHLLGEDTEVDKTIVEKISDPLVHIVRNAVDHGIEAPADRLAKGKPARGTVELMAFHEGSNLVIQVTDDGKGIDPQVLRGKAIQKRIISESAQLSDQELIQLIFHPGFSTKEVVTEVSGRGVGMDVVKTNIEGLGGHVKVMSKVNEGSSLKITLPLTLAIIEGVVVQTQDDKFVLPLSQIFEIKQVEYQEIEEFSEMAKLFRLRGEVLPLFHLNKKVGKKICTNRKRETVLVVRGPGHAFGVAIDDILNQQQIVIKKLGDDVRAREGIIGSAIMPDGLPCVILDLFELYKNDLKESARHQRQQFSQAS